MKRAPLIGLLAIAAICALPAISQADLDIAVGMVASDVSLGEALLAAGIAYFLGFDTHVAAYYHNREGLPVPSVLTALLFARMFDVDHHRITTWRSQGRGWGRIAQDLGVHPGAFNKLRKGLDVRRMDDDEFERLVFIWYLSQYYGVDEYRIHNWVRAGHPLLSVLIALDLGAKSGRSVSDLFSARGYLASWDAVADKVKVSKVARRHPQRPKGGQEFRGKAHQGGAGRGVSGGSSGGAPGHKSGKGWHGSQGRAHK